MFSCLLILSIHLMRACLWVYIQVYPSLAPILLVIYPMVSSSYTLQQSPFGNMSYNWLCWLSFELRHSYNYSSTCLGRPPSWAATLSMPRPTHFNVKLPLISGHLQRTDTFAWSRGCPFMTGITVLSFKLIPWIQRSILVLFTRCSSFFLMAQHSAPYTMVGLNTAW